MRIFGNETRAKKKGAAEGKVNKAMPWQMEGVRVFYDEELEIKQVAIFHGANADENFLIYSTTLLLNFYNRSSDASFETLARSFADFIGKDEPVMAVNVHISKIKDLFAYLIVDYHRLSTFLDSSHGLLDCSLQIMACMNKVRAVFNRYLAERQHAFLIQINAFKNGTQLEYEHAVQESAKLTAEYQYELEQPYHALKLQMAIFREKFTRYLVIV